MKNIPVGKVYDAELGLSSPSGRLVRHSYLWVMKNISVGKV
jgi:hypothetical protein